MIPDGNVCQPESGVSDIDMAGVRRKAETILSDLAKHLVALKESEGRLSVDAKRLYLQVRILNSRDGSIM